MKLYLIQRLDEVGYDQTAGVVARAKSEKKAREIAAEHHGDEGREIWLDSTKSTCKYISTALASSMEGLILRDYRAG